ncbi:TlpA family protein disulfide reductase [Cellulophaga tyrosinoxydans]|jgi:thiol-disulfide isomerase/thioredoxin|uniref:Thiol-disulfide isomerase or thioredoxin n=1 Tax=Cellulophaga tyrosinoxydans TaxID=504486 RepID=A0A1W2C281_9FLAO|nr:TlpA disulfide reductase family protein [Cellulophaga tyrosinoxydans]SMC79345.1 Thiol-disulfide isomerase or thioredoxin [Cellulophaga tyrosinoxydans]|tara:strand:- start:350 stop:910 length:561 start_codon:yes stop_codon:yes gene_type:complete
MKITKKTVLNILLFAFIISFFVTPLGDYSKVLLNKIFSFSPSVTEESDRNKITDYDWKLKDANWDLFNFKQSKGKVVFVNFWASWVLPCEAELQSIQGLYDKYQGKVDFYIITNEEREPVEAFMAAHNLTFPVTYLFIGEKMPLKQIEAPSSYLIDKEGNIVIYKKGIADWDNSKIYELLDKLLAK